jgi:hypothetical protein
MHRSKIIISSRSPLRYTWQDPRVRWIGIDFLDPVEKLETQLRPLCQDVTHAFFASYVHTDGFSELRDCNEPLFENFLTSIDNIAGPALQRVILQTGGKVGKTTLRVMSAANSEVALWCASRPCVYPVS